MSTHSHEAHDDVSARECADFIDQIVYLLDNELSSEECAAVRAHLDSCSPCLEKYDLQRTVKQVVARSCAESAPDGLRERVRLQLQQVRVEYGGA